MKIENQKQHNINFGWCKSMHGDMTHYALKGVVPKKVLEKFCRYVQLPDEDEAFLYGQKHFLGGFLDFRGKSNARYAARQHIKELYKDKRDPKSDEHAFRFLHYLQDITQPNHIEKSSIFKKIRDAIIPHHKFEVMMCDNQEELYKNSQEVPLRSNNLKNLFEEVLSISSKNEPPSRKNQEKWFEIAQNGINLALSATRRFFEIVNS